MSQKVKLFSVFSLSSAKLWGMLIIHLNFLPELMLVNKHVDGILLILPTSSQASKARVWAISNDWQMCEIISQMFSRTFQTANKNGLY